MRTNNRITKGKWNESDIISDSFSFKPHFSLLDQRYAIIVWGIGSMNVWFHLNKVIARPGRTELILCIKVCYYIHRQLIITDIINFRKFLFKFLKKFGRIYSVFYVSMFNSDLENVLHSNRNISSVFFYWFIIKVQV